MSRKDNLRATESENSDGANDPAYELLLEYTLESDLRDATQVGDVDPQLLEDDLADVDHLGTDEEFADAIIASEDAPVDEQADAATRCVAAGGEADETIADNAAALARPLREVTEEFAPMIQNVNDFEKNDEVTFISGYEKIRKLGSGGQGTVYLVEARDDFSAARALKVFKPSVEYMGTREFDEDMYRQCDVAMRISRIQHDDLVDIDWFGKLDGVFVMLMKYIDGFDLRYLLQRDLLKRLKQRVSAQRFNVLTDVIYAANGDNEQLKINPAMAVYITERVLRGLEAMHNIGVVHGDIKPSNIMLNASGSVKIIDIGSAFHVARPPAQHHITYAYTAPEYLQAQRMQMASDLSSVGYMLIEMLSGKSMTKLVKAPEGSTRTLRPEIVQRVLKEKQDLPNRLREILPPNVCASNHLVELCRRLITPDLNERFVTADQCIVDPSGTYEFARGLARIHLSVSGFREIRRWLADVRLATREAAEKELELPADSLQ